MVYLLHFEKPLEHAQHYLGATEQPLSDRLMTHYIGQGSKLLKALKQHEISWKLVRVWEGSFQKEKSLKRLKNSRKLCPVCQFKISYQEAELKVMAQLSFEQVKAERDEMEKQMVDYRNQLEASNFWQGVFKDFSITSGLIEQAVQKELIDYYWIIQSVGKVYHHLSEGHITQQSTKPEEVIRVVEDILSRRILEAEDKLQIVIDSLMERHEITVGLANDQATDLIKVSKENDRLLAGNFTPSEFQNLCHSFSEKHKEEFASGCISYMEQLFGSCPLTWKEDNAQ